MGDAIFNDTSFDSILGAAGCKQTMDSTSLQETSRRENTTDRGMTAGAKKVGRSSPTQPGPLT